MIEPHHNNGKIQHEWEEERTFVHEEDAVSSEYRSSHTSIKRGGGERERVMYFFLIYHILKQNRENRGNALIERKTDGPICRAGGVDVKCEQVSAGGR
jgi:hypothetical protein